MNFGTLLANSLLYATVGSALAVSLALVPRVRPQPYEVPGKKIIFGLLLTGLMLPQQTVLMFRLRHAAPRSICSTPKLGLIIVHGVYGMPAQILILRGFMTTIPREIEKAAYLEGASIFKCSGRLCCRFRCLASWSATP